MKYDNFLLFSAKNELDATLKKTLGRNTIDKLFQHKEIRNLEYIKFGIGSSQNQKALQTLFESLKTMIVESQTPQDLFQNNLIKVEFEKDSVFKNFSLDKSRTKHTTKTLPRNLRLTSEHASKQTPQNASETTSFSLKKTFKGLQPR